jgi:hypothetical protein
MLVARPVEPWQQGGSVVARYYFDTYDGRNWSEDEQGLECEAQDDVQEIAQLAFADLIKDKARDGGRLKICVRDDDGPLMEIHLSIKWLLPGPKPS